MVERWSRWQSRWSPADGLTRVQPLTAPALAAQRLSARPYSLTALQRFATCPYQFQLAAIYGLAPLEAPAPLQRLDPLTRGSLFHEIQTAFFRRLQQNDLLPVTPARARAALGVLDWAFTTIIPKAYDDLAPAIDRVWRDEIDGLRRDLRIWLERQLTVDGAQWVPERFELAFGLPADRQRDPASTRDPVRVGPQGFLLRGSIDLVERRLHGKTLRVTDHKTGKNRTSLATIVDGGRVLQPVLYSVALEALTGDTVEEGRLSYCTTAGNFTTHPIPHRRPDPPPRPRGAGDRRSRHRARHAGRQARPLRRPQCLRLLRLPAGVRIRRGAPHREQAGAARPRRAAEDAVTAGHVRRCRRSPPHQRRSRRDAGGRSGRRHRQDHRTGQAHRAAGADRPRLDRPDRRRDLLGESGRRAEAAPARGAGAGPPGARSSRRRGGAARSGGAAVRGSARQHHPRLLRRPAAGTAGRGPPRSVVRRAHRRPGGPAVRRGLHRVDPARARRSERRAFADRCAGSRPATSVRTSTTTRRSPGSSAPASTCWSGATIRGRGRRPDGFDRDAQIDHLLDAIGTFSQISQLPPGTRDTLHRDTEPLRRAWAEIDPGRERGFDDYDGWEAALCALAARQHDLRRGKSTSGHYSKEVPRAQVVAARDLIVDALVAFRDRADADLAALVHEALQRAIAGYEARKQRTGAVDFLDLLIRARDLVRDTPARPPRLPTPLPLPAGRRVPGHRPAAGGAAAAARRRRVAAPSRRPPPSISPCDPARCSSSAIRSSRSTASAAPTSASTARSASRWWPPGRRWCGCAPRSAACRRSSGR